VFTPLSALAGVPPGQSQHVNVSGAVTLVKSVRRSVHTKHGTDVLKSEIVLADIVEFTIWGDALHNMPNFESVVCTVGSALCWYGVGVSSFRGNLGLSTRKGSRVTAGLPRTGALNAAPPPVIVPEAPVGGQTTRCGERFYTLVGWSQTRRTFHLASGLDCVEVGVPLGLMPETWLQHNGVEAGDRVVLLHHRSSYAELVPLAGTYVGANQWLLEDIARLEKEKGSEDI